MRTLSALGLLALLFVLLSTGDAIAEDTVTTPDSDGDVGWESSIALNADGNPVVAYYDRGNGDLKLMHCNDPDCAGEDESITSPDTEGDVGANPSLALNSQGFPVVAYHDVTNDDLKLLICDDSLCDGEGDVITSPDTEGSVGRDPSLVLDADGNPVVAYWDNDESSVKVLHCDDPVCDGEGDSITSPDPGSEEDLSFAPRLVLDGAGNPVIAYTKSSLPWFVRIMRCNDPACDGGDEAFGDPLFGEGTERAPADLKLDAEGNPVVLIRLGRITDAGSIVHCDNPLCDGTQTEQIYSSGPFDSPDRAFLALDGDGNPVIVFHGSVEIEIDGQRDYSTRLMVMHCDDPACLDPRDEALNQPLPEDQPFAPSSMALDSAGNPAIALYGGTNVGLGLLHCDDPNCEPETGPGPPPIPVGCKGGMQFDNTIVGTNGNDTLTGTPGNDLIFGLAGNDTLRGLGGADCLVGGSGYNIVEGGDGNDVIYGGSEGNRIDGGAGNDRIHGGSAFDHIRGGPGDDMIYAEGGNDMLTGDDGNDRIQGDEGDDVIRGGPGFDEIHGGPGNDTLMGNEGDDTILGDEGDDFIEAGPGDDYVGGGEGDDVLLGNEGDDTLEGGPGDDFLIGSSGNDFMAGQEGHDTLEGNSGTDTCEGEVKVSCEAVAVLQ